MNTNIIYGHVILISNIKFMADTGFIEGSIMYNLEL